MWRRIKRVSWLLAGVATVSGCEGVGEPVAPEAALEVEAMVARAPRSSAPSIVEIALGTGQHDVLAAAVVALGLDGALSGTDHYTVFAPTDAAFAAVCGTTVPATCIENLVAALGSADAVREVVLFHVTRGDRNSTSVLAARQLRMLNGGVAGVTVSGATASIAGAPIVATDIRARNGIVHVVGGVMLP
jgi:uncharacterized surface protein with fasciclin (FAS1) repeats